MFIEFLKSTIKKWLPFTGGSRYVQAYGRGTIVEGEEDELLQAKDYSCPYGFRSKAPVGTELATLKNGANVWVLGQNDGILPNTASTFELNDREVMIYKAPEPGDAPAAIPYVYLRGQTAAVHGVNSTVLLGADKNGSIELASMGPIYHGGGTFPIVYCNLPGITEITDLSQLSISTTNFIKP